MSTLISQAISGCFFFSQWENKGLVFKILPNLIRGIPDNVLCHLHLISQICCFSPLFSSELLSLELCLCRWPCRSVHRAALCHRGWRAGWRAASLSGWWQSLWWNAGPGRAGREEWKGVGCCSAPPGAASPSLLMVSAASQDQWLRQGGFFFLCWPHFVQDEIHIYPPPHEDR